MKSVMLSIRPRWCELIASGRKIIEVRKTRPKLDAPFKCYIYCTADPSGWAESGCSCREEYLEGHAAGKVIGKFVCDDIKCFDVPYPAFQDKLDKSIITDSCCTYYMLHRYAYHGALYGWHISDLKIYDKPRELGEFKQCHKCPYGPEERCNEHEFSCDGTYNLSRPPQSWYYVEVPDES